MLEYSLDACIFILYKYAYIMYILYYIYNNIFLWINFISSNYLSHNIQIQWWKFHRTKRPPQYKTLIKHLSAEFTHMTEIILLDWKKYPGEWSGNPPSTPIWKIPWKEGFWGQSPWGCWRVGHNWSRLHFHFSYYH